MVAIFEKIDMFKFFLCELPLILGVTRKRKEQAEDICKGTPDIEFEQDWSVDLGAILATGTKSKSIFLVSGIFSGRSDSVILMGFELTRNPQNLIKIVRAIFEKFEKLIFFLCELPLILGVGGKLKKRLEIFT